MNSEVRESGNTQKYVSSKLTGHWQYRVRKT